MIYLHKEIEKFCLKKILNFATQSISFYFQEKKKVIKKFKIVSGKVLVRYFWDTMVYIALQHFWRLLLATPLLMLRVVEDDVR